MTHVHCLQIPKRGAALTVNNIPVNEYMAQTRDVVPISEHMMAIVLFIPLIIEAYILLLLLLLSFVQPEGAGGEFHGEGEFLLSLLLCASLAL